MTGSPVREMAFAVDPSGIGQQIVGLAVTAIGKSIVVFDQSTRWRCRKRGKNGGWWSGRIGKSKESVQGKIKGEGTAFYESRVCTLG